MVTTLTVDILYVSKALLFSPYIHISCTNPLDFIMSIACLIMLAMIFLVETVCACGHRTHDRPAARSHFGFVSIRRVKYLGSIDSTGLSYNSTRVNVETVNPNGCVRNTHSVTIECWQIFPCKDQTTFAISIYGDFLLRI